MLATQIKAALFFKGKINPLHIQLRVEDAVVYLLGDMQTEESERASELISSFHGVKKVVKILCKESYDYHS